MKIVILTQPIQKHIKILLVFRTGSFMVMVSKFVIYANLDVKKNVVNITFSYSTFNCLDSGAYEYEYIS